MAKYDKVPRKQKKDLKKSAGLQGQKIPKKQMVDLANKEAQKKKRDAATARRFNQNKDYLRDLGVPVDIISKSTSIKETKRRAAAYLDEQRKAKRRDQQYQRYANKILRLLDAGFTQEEASAAVGPVWRPLSDKKIGELIKSREDKSSPIKFSSDTWLYIGFADVTNGFMVEDLTNVTDNELKELINYLRAYAKDNPDDSSGFKGAFVAKFGSESEMRAMASYYYSKGYDLRPEVLKLSEYSFSKITLSNTFTQRDFWEMIYQCISQMKNEDVTGFFTILNRYCERAGFPFMKNLNK